MDVVDFLLNNFLNILPRVVGIIMSYIVREEETQIFNIDFETRIKLNKAYNQLLMIFWNLNDKNLGTLLLDEIHSNVYLLIWY